MTDTRTRPRSLTLAAWFFIAMGSITVVYGVWPPGVWPRGAAAPMAPDLAAQHSLDGVYAAISRLAAVVGGAFVLRRHDWARGLLVAWLVFHVVVGFLHGSMPGVIHVALFAAGTYVLFRPAASAWFRGAASP